MLPTFKTIVEGRLEFGNERAYEQVFKMFLHRLENYYKHDIFLDEEEIFNEDVLALIIPRTVVQSSDKSWKNTVSLLEYIAQFAIEGKVHAWVVESGTIIKKVKIEPSGDKAAVIEFKRGFELMKDKGKEEEAIEAMDAAIKKYEKHARAYEIRGFMNIRLQNYSDALRDFTKSIKLNPNSPWPYYGKAKVKKHNGDFEGAIEELEFGVKKCIPLQSIHWRIRRMKADCLLELKDYKGALLDLKLYTNRRIKQDDLNYLWKKDVFYKYGLALSNIGDYKEAISAFDKALDFADQKATVNDAEIYFQKGLAAKKAGVTGYKKDFTKAKDLGYDETRLSAVLT
ncbi:MAG: tetratricopeptide repeat protein [Bacteroidia bacterium]|nr:tetratricopeptide repeat protein [Bacteroidia bacterium]